MSADRDRDALIADLGALGRAGGTRVDEDRLAQAVLSRLAGAPETRAATAMRPRFGRTPVGRRWRTGRFLFGPALARHRRRAAVAVLVVLLGLLGVPAVRAEVGQWFTFAGVGVLIQPMPPAVTPAPPPPTAGRTTSLAQARALAGFAPWVPAALGAPDGIEVSADRRVLSLTWNGPVVLRLDEFPGRLDYVFVKTAPGLHGTRVAGADAIWFDRPHEVSVLDAAGTSRAQPARLAGHTLIWETGDTVLRLEGDLTLTRAREIAESVRTQP